MNPDPYHLLAQRLDSLPNGYPPTADGVELRILQRLFTPDEALLASQLRLTPETVEQLAGRLEADPAALRLQLKNMTRSGLITARRTEAGVGYAIMPFVVGIYEMQVGRLDADFAQLFESYYQQCFSQVLAMQPSVHRVIPVGESVKAGMEIHPFESAADLVGQAKAWGVVDCICRVQKALVGDPCQHPLDVCMVLSPRSGVFDGSEVVRALSLDGALETLHRAASAGLVHSVSNTQQGISYICNCCTCSCGILRGMSEMGMANVIARSAFLNQVEGDLCVACELCIEYCQFDALTLQGVAVVDELRCVGCGVCVPACPEGALGLIRRPEADVAVPVLSEAEWMQARATARGLDIRQVL